MCICTCVCWFYCLRVFLVNEYNIVEYLLMYTVCGCVNTLMPLRTVTTGGCLGVEVMVMVNIWLSRRLLSPSYTTKWKMSVTGWLPVSKEVMYL